MQNLRLLARLCPGQGFQLQTRSTVPITNDETKKPANLMKNFIKLSVVPGNLTMDQYRGFRTITICPATQTNPPCSSLRATVTKLPSKGTVFQPLMTAGTLSDKRGPPILSVDTIILPSISAAGNVIILQYQAREVGVKPVAGAIWDSIECEPSMRRARVCLFV